LTSSNHVGCKWKLVAVMLVNAHFAHISLSRVEWLRRNLLFEPWLRIFYAIRSASVSANEVNWQAGPLNGWSMHHLVCWTIVDELFIFLERFFLVVPNLWLFLLFLFLWLLDGSLLLSFCKFFWIDRLYVFVVTVFPVIRIWVVSFDSIFLFKFILTFIELKSFSARKWLIF
jgi:hypothetical protein